MHCTSHYLAFTSCTRHNKNTDDVKQKEQKKETIQSNLYYVDTLGNLASVHSIQGFT